MYKKASISFKYFAILFVTVYVSTYVVVDFLSLKQTEAAALGLPEPTALLQTSSQYFPALLKGIKLNPDNPLELDFIVDPGDERSISKQSAMRQIKYFLTALTTPVENIWVNLSPYEENRVLQEKLRSTELGKDLVAQDYILKQFSSSLTHPQTESGKSFWMQRNDNLKSDFNKIWIVPKKATVKEDGYMAIICSAELKVMTDVDYYAKLKNELPVNNAIVSHDYNSILPLIEKEVNNNKNFSTLRQIYNAIILAQWFKNKFANSFYKAYFDMNKLAGIESDQKATIESIFKFYTKSFDKGVYRIAKKNNRQLKKYFSGGSTFERYNSVSKVLSSTIEPYDFNMIKSKQGSNYQKIKANLAQLISNPKPITGTKHEIKEYFVRAVTEARTKYYSQLDELTYKTSMDVFDLNQVFRASMQRIIMQLMASFGLNEGITLITTGSFSRNTFVEGSDFDWYFVYDDQNFSSEKRIRLNDLTKVLEACNIKFDQNVLPLYDERRIELINDHWGTNKDIYSLSKKQISKFVTGFNGTDMYLTKIRATVDISYLAGDYELFGSVSTLFRGCVAENVDVIQDSIFSENVFRNKEEFNPKEFDVKHSPGMLLTLNRIAFLMTLNYDVPSEITGHYEKFLFLLDEGHITHSEFLEFTTALSFYLLLRNSIVNASREKYFQSSGYETKFNDFVDKETIKRMGFEKSEDFNLVLKKYSDSVINMFETLVDKLSGSSSSGVNVNNKVGGIDFENMNIELDKTSSAILRYTPKFNLNTLVGFEPKISSIDEILPEEIISG